MTNVSVTGGAIAGVEQDGIYAFKGIPFAAPVAGRNLWLPPQPVARWDGVRDASAFGEICPQPSVTSMGKLAQWFQGRLGRQFIQALRDQGEMGTDCLNLNVWTSTLDPQAGLPVMVWIHGGALINGSGSNRIYDGAHLASDGVVLVSINYRLGCMGFLGGEGLFADGLAEGNRGFMDQVAALRWVQENARQFGGDPDNVTIFGESAGGSSVSAMMATPSAKGLFHRGICMSGVPDTMFAETEYAEVARRVLSKLGVQPGDTDGLLGLSIGNLLLVQLGIGRMLNRGGGEAFGALGDTLHSFGVATGTEFAPTALLAADRQGLHADVDLLLGTCANDGRLLPVIIPGSLRIASRLAMRILSGMFNPPHNLSEATARYRSVLPGLSTFDLRDRMLTDALFRRPTVRLADLHASRHPGRTWLYRFDWVSTPTNPYASMHAFDIPFAFGNFELFTPLFRTLDNIAPLNTQIRTAWVNFAREGTPGTEGLSSWEPYNPDTRPCMVLNNESRMEWDLDAGVREVW